MSTTDRFNSWIVMLGSSMRPLILSESSVDTVLWNVLDSEMEPSRKSFEDRRFAGRNVQPATVGIALKQLLATLSSLNRGAIQTVSGKCVNLLNETSIVLKFGNRDEKTFNLARITRASTAFYVRIHQQSCKPLNSKALKDNCSL